MLPSRPPVDTAMLKAVVALLLLGICLGAADAGNNTRTCSGGGIYSTSEVAWQQLSSQQQAAAGVCGYSQATWDGTAGAPCAKCFEDLSESKQQAVQSIGTDQQCWNQGMMKAGMSCQSSPRSSAPQGAICLKDLGLYKTAMVGWQDLSTKQQAGAKTCGYDQTSWDGPSACKKCFADLTQAQQQAVLVIGTDQQCWDSYVGFCGTSQKFDASFQVEPASSMLSSKLPWAVFPGLLVSLIGLSGIRFAMAPAQLTGSDQDVPSSPGNQQAHCLILQSGEGSAAFAYGPITHDV